MLSTESPFLSFSVLIRPMGYIGSLSSIYSSDEAFIEQRHLLQRSKLNRIFSLSLSCWYPFVLHHHFCAQWEHNKLAASLQECGAVNRGLDEWPSCCVHSYFLIFIVMISRHGCVFNSFNRLYCISPCAKPLWVKNCTQTILACCDESVRLYGIVLG